MPARLPDLEAIRLMMENDLLPLEAYPGNGKSVAMSSPCCARRKLRRSITPSSREKGCEYC